MTRALPAHGRVVTAMGNGTPPVGGSGSIGRLEQPGMPCRGNCRENCHGNCRGTRRSCLALLPCYSAALLRPREMRVQGALREWRLPRRCRVTDPGVSIDVRSCPFVAKVIIATALNTASYPLPALVSEKSYKPRVKSSQFKRTGSHNLMIFFQFDQRSPGRHQRGIAPTEGKLFRPAVGVTIGSGAWAVCF